MKPILFNTENVIAILEDRKGATRRIMKPQPTNPRWNNIGWLGWDDGHGNQVKQIYPLGEILYVRETWQQCYELDGNDQIIEGTEKYVYAATPEDVPHFTHWVRADGTHADFMPWRPSIHMPKEAARIFLRVNDVRVERLQDITEEQCYREGVEREAGEVGADFVKGIFHGIWDRTIKKQDLDRCGWEANPWVWVTEFGRCEKTEAAL